MTLSSSVIFTPRLELVPLVADDAGEMAIVLGDERMHEFTGGVPMSVDELRERYSFLVVGRSPDGSELWFNWIVRSRADAAAVGVVQATVAAGGASANIAWEVGTPWQRKGYASEAASAMAEWLIHEGVTIIEAHIHAGHRASCRVAEHIGLKPTAETIDGEAVWRCPTDTEV